VLCSDLGGFLVCLNGSFFEPFIYPAKFYSISYIPNSREWWNKQGARIFLKVLIPDEILRTLVGTPAELGKTLSLIQKKSPPYTERG